MDGYIKKSEAVDVIVKYPYDIAGKTATAIKMIEDLPSADVVPKSEVERLQAEKDALIKNYAECMKDYAKEIFKEIDNLKKQYIKGDIDEHKFIVRLFLLKKKYTEGKDDRL